MIDIAARDSQPGVPSKPPIGYRGTPRRRLAVPLNVTVLRSGVPDAVPGRCIDVSGGGVGAVLAAEVHPGELVGIEFRLPDSASVLAKARVCYQERLRCGLQFLAIPAEQKTAIEAWAAGRSVPGAAASQPSLETQQPQPKEPRLPNFLAEPKANPARKSLSNARFVRGKIVAVLAASVVVAAAVGWWQWQQAWQELESRLPGHTIDASQSPVPVDWEVMQRLLVHNVAIPAVPGARMKGMAVLSAVVGRDGSVVRVRPVSGPDVLTRAAMESVQWWKFEPYRVKGTPVEVETTLALEFR